MYPALADRMLNGFWPAVCPAEGGGKIGVFSEPDSMFGWLKAVVDTFCCCCGSAANAGKTDGAGGMDDDVE